MRGYGYRTRCAGKVASRFGQHRTDDGFYVLFCGSCHELGTGGRWPVRKRLFVADGDHAVVDRVRVGELARFTGKGLGVAFADLKIPIWIFRVINNQDKQTRNRRHET